MRSESLGFRKLADVCKYYNESVEFELSNSSYVIEHCQLI